MRITHDYEITGCGAIGPLGYRCTRHENGEHVARGLTLESFGEAWPIVTAEPVTFRGHNFTGEESVCERCECAPGYITTDCPGFPLTAYQKGRVARGRLDYVASDEEGWKQKITLPRFVGSFEEVTAFLNAELAQPVAG
jgi:hypothetical protein